MWLKMNNKYTSERKEKMKIINGLLNRHNLTLIWQNILNRWILIVVDAYNREVWRRRGMNVKVYRDELIGFLENYNGQRPTTD